MDSLEVDTKDDEVAAFLQQLTQCSIKNLTMTQITDYQEFMCRLFYKSIVTPDAAEPAEYAVRDEELFALFLRAVEPTLDTLRAT